MDAGIPAEYASLTLDFNYNDQGSVKALFEKYKGQIAALIMEPAEGEEPRDNFLNKVQVLCKEYGVVYILDEMITGFRWDLQGACKYYGVEPDLVTYGKGMANGFSVAALGGKREIMELGGIDHDKERVFLISTTHGAEMASLGAFVETVKVYQELDVTKTLWRMGEKLTSGIDEISKELGLEKYFYTTGASCSPNYVTMDANHENSLEFRTLFCQELIKDGILMPYIAVCYEHSDEDIERTLTATRRALKVYKMALENGIDHYLESRAIKPVFRKNN